MNTQVLHECTQLTLAGKATFLEAIQRLLDADIDRFIFDIAKTQVVYYSNDNKKYVDPFVFYSTASQSTWVFKEAGIKHSIKQITSGEINSASFTQQLIEYGVTNVKVMLHSKQIIFYGSRGETYIESF